MACFGQNKDALKDISSVTFYGIDLSLIHILDEGQIMNQYFRYFGIMDKLSIKRMAEEVFDRIYYKDAIYDLSLIHI